MSVLLCTVNGWIMSHENFVRDIYKNVTYMSLNRNVTLEYSKTYFSINTPFMFNVQSCKFYEAPDEKVNKLKKRKRKVNMSVCDSFSEIQNINEEVTDVKHKYENLIERAQKNGHLVLQNDEEIHSENNLEARLSSGKFFSELSGQNIAISNGGNCNDYAIIVSCDGQDFVFPAGSKFYCCDVKDFPSKVLSEVFDLILMDPPWWNKYIRREKSKNAVEGYKMMYNKELKDLPIASLLAQEGLVAVWCTNSSSHIQDLTNEIFPAWGIEYLATWYWIKVTKGGKTVCSFSKPPGKQPYERIIFGSKNDRGKKYPQPEDKKCIVSVPSAIHSHKPPLAEVLAYYLPPSPHCLELFARYLLPYWTSCGDQVLSLQNIKLFNQEPVIKKFKS